MKKLVCLGFVALGLGAHADVNDPPLNVWSTVSIYCEIDSYCSYGLYSKSIGYYGKCSSGTQTSCHNDSTCTITTTKYYGC